MAARLVFRRTRTERTRGGHSNRLESQMRTNVLEQGREIPLDESISLWAVAEGTMMVVVARTITKLTVESSDTV